MMSSFNATAVLKTVENLGVSYVKLSDQYTKKLDSESKALNFPYRPDAVSIFIMKEDQIHSVLFSFSESSRTVLPHT